MKIEEIPIDDRIKKALSDQGIKELYPPQEDAIKKNLLQEQNMVVAVPTASGKTLIAILAIFSSLLKYPGSKAVYLAPLRALASEKFQEFRIYAKELGLRVAISTGDLDENSGWLGGSDVIIATNEKFDSLIRHQVSWLNEIKVVVSDEVHLINDSSRGPVLEVVLSLIRRNLPRCQIVALSATIINADEIAEWLDAELILSSWRPVELREAVWCEGELTYNNAERKSAGESNDKTGYTSLAIETVLEGGQALVFANTRKTAVSSADILSMKLPSYLSYEDKERLHEIASKIRSVGEKTELREKLASLVEAGVAFHHAGLAGPHRRIVEDHFKSRDIKVIAATPTLAAGVNLPGRRVIIRSVSRYNAGIGYTAIPVLEYKQMAGRAGRPRYDPYGEAIILAKNMEEGIHYLERFIRAETEEIYSKLGYEPALRAHILAFVSAEYVDSFKTAMDMIAITFYGYQNDGSMFLVEEEIWKVFDLLIEAKLISPEEPYQVTPFGRRVSELYLDPLSARVIKIGLEAGQERSDIPLVVYLQLVSNTPDIRNYSVRQKDMPKLMQLAEKHNDQWLNTDFEEMEQYEVDLFFATLKIAYVIDMWLNEASEEKIYLEMGMSSGDLHAALERIKWLVHCAAEISKIFKWKGHRKTLLNIDRRLKYGVSEELLQLVEIKGIGRIRARTLYDNGFKTLESIQNAALSAIIRLPGFGEAIAKNLKAIVSGETNTSIIEDEIVIANQNSANQSSLSNFFD